MTRGTQRAFTLIEIMIAIAIIAIMFAVTTSTLLQFGAFQRQKEFRNSLVQSSAHYDYLQKTDFLSLPPEVKTVNSNGTISLSQKDIVPDSVTVRDSQTGEELSFAPYSPESQELKLEGTPSGASVVVDYDFFLPAENICHFADDQAKVQLSSSAELQVHNVSLATGDKLEKLTDFHLEGRELVLPSRAANRLVVIDLLDEKQRNRVSGEFLGQDLKPSTAPSTTKLLQVQEPYQGVFRMSLPFLKEAQQ